MEEKNKMSSFIPKLDTFDVMSIVLWFAILVPSLQLPSNATYTFIRAVFFIAWVAVLAIFVALRIYREKRIIFFSATVGNLVMALFAACVFLSFLLSASKVDSLYGFDLTFSSSAMIFSALIALYFILKLAGLSLELAISRVLSVLPFSLAIVDIISVIAFVLPTAFYTKVFSNYAQYFSHLNSSPIALIGTIQTTVAVHLVALIVVIFQLSNALKSTKSVNFEVGKRSVLAIILASMGSLVLFASYSFSWVLLLVIIGVLAVIGIALFSSNNKQSGSVLTITVIAAIYMSLLGFIWGNYNLVGKSQTANISGSVTSQVMQQSFLNTSTPMWRQVTGFGVGTFPYLYLQYRNVDAAINYGNTSYFYKPNNFLTELFFEHGALGVLAFIAILGAVIFTYIKSSSRNSVSQEIIILAVLVGMLLVLPSTLATLVLLFVTLAAYFDKVESLPELLPSIHAIDLKESLYTNRSVSRGNIALLVLAFIFSFALISSLFKPSMTMLTYTRAMARVSAAQNDTKATTQQTATALMNAYNTSVSGLQYCKECSQLNYLNVNILLSLQSMYDSLSETEKQNSTELRQVKNLLLQSVTDLIAKTPSRYDYWLSVAQAYKTFAENEKATSFYVLAVQSVSNALAINNYSIDGNYLYIDVLLGLGNDQQVNTAVTNRLAILKQVVGTPVQEQLIEGILAARLGKYDDAIAILEKIKKDVALMTSVSDEQKKQINKIVDDRVTEVKKLKTPAANPTVTPTPATK